MGASRAPNPHPNGGVAVRKVSRRGGTTTHVSLKHWGHPELPRGTAVTWREAAALWAASAVDTAVGSMEFAAFCTELLAHGCAQGSAR